MRMENSRNSKVIFPFAPRPFLRESIASWVIRLCSSHDYTFARLKNLVNVKVKKSDWDDGMNRPDMLRLLQSSGLECEDFFGQMVNAVILRQHGVNLHPRDVDGYPYYAFCPLCFAEDEVPYLRWHWRYANYKECRLHRRKLFTKCQHCGARLETSRPILRDLPNEVFISNFGYCKICAQPLFVFFEKKAEPYKYPWERSKDWVRSVDPHDKNSVGSWLLLGEMGSSSWKLRFDLPAEIKPVWTPRKKGLKQYRNLSIYGRAKVAKALRIIRAEKHRQRSEQRIDVQEAAL